MHRSQQSLSNSLEKNMKYASKIVLANRQMTKTKN